jgi:putative membrane protein
MTTQEPPSANQLAQERTDLAAIRTMMAADRTLMAWIRTAFSLISFGFTIYKILQAFQQTGAELPREHTPRNIGMFLTAMGTVAMVMGTIEYWHTLKEMRLLSHFSLARPALIMALLMSVGGVFMFFSIITKLF